MTTGPDLERLRSADLRYRMRTSFRMIFSQRGIDPGPNLLEELVDDGMFYVEKVMVGDD